MDRADLIRAAGWGVVAYLLHWLLLPFGFFIADLTRLPLGGSLVRVFAHPLRLDSEGAVATVDQGSLLHAQQLAIGIVSTFLGERPLAPDFGIFDPVAVGTSVAEVTAAVDLCEPDLKVVDVTITQVDDQQQVQATVAWDFDGEEV